MFFNARFACCLWFIGATRGRRFNGDCGLHPFGRLFVILVGPGKLLFFVLSIEITSVCITMIPIEGWPNLRNSFIITPRIRAGVVVQAFVFVKNVVQDDVN